MADHVQVLEVLLVAGFQTRLGFGYRMRRLQSICGFKLEGLKILGRPGLRLYHLTLN